jgi:hypothetical protein
MPQSVLDELVEYTKALRMGGLSAQEIAARMVSERGLTPLTAEGVVARVKDPFDDLVEHARALMLAEFKRGDTAARLIAETGLSAESVEAALTRVFGPPPPSVPPPPPAPSDPNASWPWKS